MITDSKREAFFDNLSSSWDGMASEPKPEHLDALLAAAAINRGDRVIDVGCGTGYMIGHIHPFGPSEIWACDLSQKMLDIVKTKYPHIAELKLIHGEAQNLPLDSDSIDVVICNGVFPHFADKDLTLKELSRIAAPGARIAISHFKGRNFVNKIHMGSANPAINCDILPPADEVGQALETHGFKVAVSVDGDDFYLVAGVKNHGQ